MLKKLHELEEILATNDPEMDAILQDALKLDSEGKLDDAAGKEIQRRIQAKSDRESISGIISEALPSKTWTPPKALRIPLLGVVFFVVIGALSEAVIGKYFIFSGINEYWQYIPWIIGLSVPLFSWSFYHAVKKNDFIRRRYPTWSIRWLVMYPLSVAFTIGMTIVAPLGWSALYGWTLGVPAEKLEARVVGIDVPQPSSRGCSQKAELSFRNASATICIENRLSGQSPKTGDIVEISGRLSQLGLFVEQVRKQ